MKKIISFFLFFIVLFSEADARRSLDSLLRIVQTEKADTNKVNHLISLCTSYDHTGNLDKAVEYGLQACTLAEQLNYLVGLASANIELGNAYLDKGAYPQALDHYMKALAAAQKGNIKKYMEMSTANLGLIYFYDNDYLKALDYYMKALKMAQKANDSNLMSINYCNMGNVYFALKDFDNAQKYFRKSMVIDSSIHSIAGVAADLNNLGNIYMQQKKYEEGISYFSKGLALAEKGHDFEGLITNMIDLGQSYLYTQDYNQAEKVLKKATDISDSMHYTQYIKNASLALSEVYEKTGKWQDAYKTYKIYTAAEDSLVNDAKSKEIGKLEAKSEYDKELALQHAETEKREALTDAESKKQKIIIGFVGSIALAVAVIALLIFRSLKTTRKQKMLIEMQKMEVETQKQLVEEKNQEVVDSITYAKRLQDAILPDISDIQKHLPESFVLYIPKAIVAGDFYWVVVPQPHLNPPHQGGLNKGTVASPDGGGKEGASIYIAACDCTGHGVPGAMVSVVCSNALNRSVKEFGITEPGKILDKTRELVLDTFSKNEGEIKDGMDVSLCSITMPHLNPPHQGGLKASPNGGREGAGITIKWAGANNPLWYVENGELKEIAPDKQPIGQTDNPKPFTTHTFTLSRPPSPPKEGSKQVNSESSPSGSGGASTCIYLFTDGFADQFGGEKGKKFKYKQLQQLILDNAKLPMAEQKKVFEKTFDNWKGFLEQTDDVCIIGIRI